MPSLTSSKQLNLKQQEAVTHTTSPLLVLAGAGSGKTSVITEKISYLIRQCHYKAYHITAVTFTNKAAKEMNSRVRTLLSPEECRGITVSTFHTLGLKILRIESSLLDKKNNFSIYDSDDSLALLKTLIEEYYPQADKVSRDDLAQETKHRISSCKNDYILPNNIEENDDSFNEEFIHLYTSYQEYLQIFNAVDFDDLILLPVLLFKQHPHILTKWQQRIHYLLVDEYQDTNVVQYELIKLLSSKNTYSQHQTQFAVVGDDDQSIYCWRGARPENLTILHQDFPDLKIVKLEQNYRSTQLILNAANQVIQNNPHAFVKKLWSNIKSQEKIDIISAQDEEAEVNHVIAGILKFHLEAHINYSDFAILYRGNYQSRPFTFKLLEHQIPFKVTGGTSFFAYTEIKDIIAYLKLLINPLDDSAFLRIINTPKRQIGQATIKKLSDYSTKTQKPLFDSCNDIGLSAYMDTKSQQKLLQFYNWLTEIKKLSQLKSPIMAIEQLLSDCDYYSWLMASASSESKAKRQIDNVNELVNWLVRIQEKHETNDSESGPAELADIVNKLILMDILEKNEEEEMTDCVSLMTMHSAKGLEFPYVFIVGVEEDILPHQTSIENDDIEEERRLFYVGITRAKYKLIISLSSTRKRYGEQLICEPSRFISELPQKDLNWLTGKDKLSLEQKSEVAKDSFATMRALLAKEQS